MTAEHHAEEHAGEAFIPKVLYSVFKVCRLRLSVKCLIVPLHVCKGQFYNSLGSAMTIRNMSTDGAFDMPKQRATMDNKAELLYTIQVRQNANCSLMFQPLIFFLG